MDEKVRAIDALAYARLMRGVIPLVGPRDVIYLEARADEDGNAEYVLRINRWVKEAKDADD